MFFVLTVLFADECLKVEQCGQVVVVRSTIADKTSDII